MAKKYLNINVYDATLSRIEYIFKEFDNVLVAFSGGKDSSVCLNMCYDYAKQHNLLGKLYMYHIDYEAQYQNTTDYVTATFARFNDIAGSFWLCLPVAAQCCCKMDSGTWTPWDRNEQEKWVRPMPDNPKVINEDNVPFKFKKNDSDYTVQDAFCKWFSKVHGSTGIVIGIRADESLNRYVAVAKDDKKIIYKEKKWCSSVNAATINCYPIYDWQVSDIWIVNTRNGYDYNKLYDLYYQAGMKPEQMRVASPFNDCAGATLKFYKVIDPNNWGKMVSRVNGVNFVGLYGNTTAMGWKNITLPKGHTWKSYCEFLMSTLDEKTRQHYERIFATSLKYWLTDGGNIDKSTYNDMMSKNNIGIKSVNQSSKYEQKHTVRFNEYPDDVDVVKFKDVPSYKRMCVCILKNDYYCKYMGFGQTKEAQRRKKATLEKYRNLL